MFGDSENLKDTSKNPLKDSISLDVPYKRQGTTFSYYPKLNKLITALYMVTDIIEKDEPIRLKLRTLGTEILSDMHQISRTDISDKVHTILSLLDIALTINLVSPMNLNILKKEFNELSRSLDIAKESNQINDTWLEEFLKIKEETLTHKILEPAKNIQNHDKPVLEIVRHRDENTSYIIKKQRRDDILRSIKDNGGTATITEVKTKGGESLANYGEKTLQRELVSMVKDNILNKTGEKRWSKYSLKN
jgi:hypothetical protein